MSNKSLQKQKIIVILGPTASGKSDLAVRVAKKFKGEVISADSRQVYRGLTIGTGKITKKEMRGVTHYLLDVADPKKQFTVAEYKVLGEKALGRIISRKHIPIVAGGTGFYIDTLVKNISLPKVKENKKLRKALAKKSLDELIAMLAVLDQRRVHTIDKRNRVRLIRAIEIALTMGFVPEMHAEERYDVLRIGIKLPADTLKKKIRTRLSARIKKGMIAEAKRLNAHGLSFGRMEKLGLEYRYLARLLQGKITKEEMIEHLETEIWHYAKRQMTWFKRDKTIHWIRPTDTKKVEKLVRLFLQKNQGVVAG